MNCKEAQELFGLIPELPDDHPQRKMLEWHTLGCESCAIEYQIWKDSQEAIHTVSVDISIEQGERMNSKVMERIYAESPWLVPDSKEGKVSHKLHRRISVWAASCVAVFLVSFLVYMFGGSQFNHQNIKPVSGVLPTAVVASDIEIHEEFSLSIPNMSRGILEPFAAQMGPSYPQYWMLLSMAGMGLALFSWKGIRRARR